MSLDPLYPWYGGKSRVADEVWRRFGPVDTYIEPFAGSASVLLRRPDAHRWWDLAEIINDADGMVANAWRAIQADPDGVAYWADWPVIENDLHARNRWLIGQRESLTERLEADPDYFDVKAAGWWLWGIGIWLGRGWAEQAYRTKPCSDIMGISRRSDIVVKQDTTESYAAHIRDVMRIYRHRMRTVRVYCGDWQRVCTPAMLQTKEGICGVFLDPPYSHAERDSELYVVEMQTADAVREWALAHGNDPSMRIALCGYEGEHEMPGTWSAYRWVANGGFANQGSGNGRENRFREVIWFSPHCLLPSQQLELDLCLA